MPDLILPSIVGVVTSAADGKLANNFQYPILGLNAELSAKSLRHLDCSSMPLPLGSEKALDVHLSGHAGICVKSAGN